MKKVFILAVVAILAMSAVYFGATISGDGVVQITYNSSPAAFTVVPTNWDLYVTSSSTGMYYRVYIADGTIKDFNVTVPVVSNLSLVLGRTGSFGESVFGGTSFGGPENGGAGWIGFGYNRDNFIGAKYTSDMFNVYAQSTFSATNNMITPHANVYADTTMGPVAIFLGAEDNFGTAYAGANVTVASANLFGQVAYDTTNATLNSYTVGANVAFGNNAITAELDNTNALTAWYNTTFGGLGVQLTAAFDNFSTFNSAAAQLSWTIVGNVSAEADFTYSAASAFSAELTMFTSF